MAKVKEILNLGIKMLEENDVQDRIIKARVLMRYVLKKTSSDFVFDIENEMNKDDEQKYLQYINQIIQGKPLQYITNVQEFFGLKFYVDENVLIPQPDTEILVERSIEVIKNKQENINSIDILDMCTGSGAVAISIAKVCNNVNVYGLDISDLALEIAKKNAKENKAKVDFFKSDMFEMLKNTKKKFDLIISNPPYIEKEVISTLSKEVQNEPHIALDGGADGLDFYRVIADNGYKYLKPNGNILVEIGYNQRKSVERLFAQAEHYGTISCINDLSGNDRVIEISI